MEESSKSTTECPFLLSSQQVKKNPKNLDSEREGLAVEECILQGLPHLAGQIGREEVLPLMSCLPSVMGRSQGKQALLGSPGASASRKDQGPGGS